MIWLHIHLCCFAEDRGQLSKFQTVWEGRTCDPYSTTCKCLFYLDPSYSWLWWSTKDIDAIMWLCVSVLVCLYMTDYVWSPCLHPPCNVNPQSPPQLAQSLPAPLLVFIPWSHTPPPLLKTSLLPYPSSRSPSSTSPTFLHFTAVNNY